MPKPGRKQGGNKGGILTYADFSVWSQSPDALPALKSIAAPESDSE